MMQLERLTSCDAEERKKVVFIFSVLTPASVFFICCIKIKLYKAPQFSVGI